MAASDDTRRGSNETTLNMALLKVCSDRPKILAQQAISKSAAARYGKPAIAVVRGRSSRADQARTAADRQV